jgi:uncharacterized membrane protein YkvA (DUF1232 family)
MEDSTPQAPSSVFAPAFARLYGDQGSAPGRLVTLGDYYGTAQLLDARGALNFADQHGPSAVREQRQQSGDGGYSAARRPLSLAQMRDAARWTQTINALNAGRKWALLRLFERLDPMIEAEVAIAVVPPHDPFGDPPAIRRLAQMLARCDGPVPRVDATGCLVRHTPIRRITFGGPSYRSLHRQTIAVAEPSLVAGRSVLLLDDVARSGASLRAVRGTVARGRSALCPAPRARPRNVPPVTAVPGTSATMALINKLQTIGKNFKRELRVYRLVLRDTRTPWLPKLLLGLAVGYALLPFDLIPDFLPVIGHLDDVILIPVLVGLALRLIPAPVVADCRRRATDEQDTAERRAAPAGTVMKRIATHKRPGPGRHRRCLARRTVSVRER